MVGKIKHVRQKLHQEAVRLDRNQVSEVQLSSGGLTGFPLPGETSKPPTSSQVQNQASFPSRVFAGTSITPEVLVQTLKFEPHPDVPSPVKKASEEKKIKSKKEKMKERRDRWLSKISSIKLAKEKEAAEARRQATPVVGDLRPLADALPELCQLIGPTGATAGRAARSRSRKNNTPMKRLEPTDFSQMKQTQKRKFLECESSRFSEAVKTISSTKNPLADIGEQLRKRMKQEEEQGS